MFFTNNNVRAKKMCSKCPVADPCLIAGMTEEFGIWGGFTAPERVRYRNELFFYIDHTIKSRYPSGWWSVEEAGTPVADPGRDQTLDQ